MHYYARPLEHGDEYEFLSNHLIRVAELSENHGRILGIPNLAYDCGLMHDFGKYSVHFQNVLLGKEVSVDHAVSGALICMECLSKRKILQSIICAHHSELEYLVNDIIRDSINNPDAEPRGKKQHYSIRTADEYKTAREAWNLEVGRLLKKDPEPIPSFGENTAARMLFTRFLLSCLVDADYTSAASPGKSISEILNEDLMLNIGKICDALSKFRKEICKESQDNENLNKLRNIVYEDCVKAGEQPPGLFTLTAPTGLGKTLSLLTFALHHAEKNSMRRVIIVLPYLSIIEQNAGIYRKICPELLEDHSQNKLTDEQREFAQRWSAPVIVTTSVKFFESFFKNQAPDNRKLHNIAGSVIVFDEAQSLPTELTRTTLDTMKQLCERYSCSVVLSTATQPAFQYLPEFEWNPTEIINNPSYLYANTRRTEVEWRVREATPLSIIAGELAECNNCCAIVNTKYQAGELYRELSSVCSSGEVYYFTTDLCPAHRGERLREITEHQRQGKPCRVISTQCIEAGVDISFDVLYRALAPLPSIVQSAGRVNRGGRSEKFGRTVVFVPDVPARKRYPNDTYQNAAIAVIQLLLNNNWYIDIQNMDQLREYYRILYLDDRQNRDKPALLKAIADCDFAGVNREYRLIPDSGCSIIIPYQGRLELYRSVVEKLQKSGLTPALMREAAPITVQVFRSAHSDDGTRIEDCCLPVYYQKKHFSDASEFSGWYIAGENNSLYSEETGFNLKQLKSII